MSDGLDIHISLRVDAAAFDGWRPEQVDAFFAGIARVLAVREPERITDAEPGSTE